MKKCITRCLIFLAAIDPSIAAAQQSSGSSPFADMTNSTNIWTRYSFGVTEIIWLAAAILIGVIGYFLYYRGLLRSELRRLPVPLEPNRHRLSAAAFGLAVAALTLGLGGFGFAYILALVAVAALMDLLGGRRWVFIVAILLIVGMIVWALYFAQ